jgi:hypothetical protein
VDAAASIAIIDVRDDPHPLSLSRVRHLVDQQQRAAMECHVFVGAHQIDAVLDMPYILAARDYFPRRIKPFNRHEFACLPNVRFFGPGHYVQPEAQEAASMERQWAAVEAAIKAVNAKLDA